MFKYLLILIGIIPSALAQIFLKFASNYQVKSFYWFLFIFFSVLSYFIAFVLYSIIFKYFPVSKASPFMTVGVMMIVVLFGIFIGEKISLQQFIGFIFGIIAIFLIMLK